MTAPKLIFFIVCIFYTSIVPFDSRAQDVILSEIHYNPLPITPLEEQAGVTDVSDFEFIELYNNEPFTVDLRGWRLDSAVEFSFPNGSILAAKSYMVIAKDEDVLPVRYSGIKIDGDYKGKLANEGERLILFDSNNQIVDQVEYSFENPWPDFANGKGGTLVRTDWVSRPSGANSWTASRNIHGTPGSESQLKPGPVIINEILAHTDPPLEDAIELLNITSGQISLGGWYLSDSISEPKKFRILPGVSIQPNKFTALYQQQFGEPFNPLVPFSLNSALGDSVYLFAADAQGNITRLADSITFPPTENSVSYGRYPDGADIFTNLKVPTFGTGVTANDSPLAINLFRKGLGAPNSDPLIGPVVIYSFDPSPEMDGQPFIQLKNISSRWVLLQDPLHPNNTWGIDGDIQFSLPRGVSLAPEDSLFIVESSASAFRDSNNLSEDVQVFGPWTGSLNSSKRKFRLYKPDPPQTRPPDIGLVPRIIVDLIEFDLEMDWEFDVIDISHFLGRKIPLNVSNLPSSWQIETELTPSIEIPQIEVQFIFPDRIEIQYSVSSDLSYDLERSSNLVSWDQLERIDGPFSGTIELSADEAETEEFFRIRRLAP